MALKSVWSIDVDDSAFLRFKSLYDKYEKSLRGMPAAWAAVNTKIDGSRASFDKLVDSMVAANIQDKLRAKASERADLLTRTTADRWRDMSRTTKTVAGNIKEATTALLKWSGIVGAVGGLLGAGGIWGIDRLAASVSAGRRSSLGLGVGYGEQRAFETNFARLVDPDAFLSDVFAAKTDVTKRVGLIGAGLTPGEIGGDTADTAIALIRNLKRIADTTNPALYAQVIAARRLTTTPEELERLRNTSPAELANINARYRENRREFDLPPDVQSKWQEFTTQMSRAGQGIEATFVRGLSPLAPGLSRLSEAFEKVVRSFLSSPTLERWITSVDKALERFADYVGTDEFASKVSDFVKNVAGLAEAAGAAAKWITSWLPTGSAPSMTGVPWAVGKEELRPGETPRRITTGDVQGMKFLPGDFARFNDAGASIPMTPQRYSEQQLSAVVAGLEKRGFSHEDAAAVAGNLAAESSLNAGAVNRFSGAFGVEQLLGQRLTGFKNYARLSGKDPNDLGAQLDWIAQERSGGSIGFGGSDERGTYRQALSAPTLAEKTAAFGKLVERPSQADLASSMNRRTAAADVAAHGRYVQSGLGNDGYSPTVVTIENNTGGNAAVSINGLKN